MKAAALPATPSSPPRQSLRFGAYRFPETAALPPASLNNVRLRSFRLFRPPRDSSSEVVRGLNFDSGKVSEGEHEWEICITRTLPPALTLEQGLQKIKEAVDKLKMDPPRTSNGMYRFQVPVPPSAKALNWFSCQPESSEVFPQFFLSKETKNPTYKSLRLNRTRGAFGIGIGASFTHSASRASECSLFTINRYLSVDSALTMAYGIMDIDFDTRSSSLKHDTGSYFFFIPQVVLDEHEDRSILALTLSWSESSLCCFEDALCSCESSLKQVGSHFWPISENCNNKFRNSTLKNFNVVEGEDVRMLCLNALPLTKRTTIADLMKLDAVMAARQFCFRLSSTLAFASNMLDPGRDLSSTNQHYGNINSVWASLIIEECSRLGLTYICVAPGSRSSPLAIAASSHPLTYCVACFDERSLAFHAVGYARGSRKPAVVITSSGTAVSNLLPAVVEASQDFVPIILLTADRPPELQDAGANQAINQVNHFGSFVRFFFSLPAPTDDIPARMLLTTFDTAVYWATNSPPGPVHINCPFREPLDNSPRKWMLSCLNGLDYWMSGDGPFTEYIQLPNSFVCNDNNYQTKEVLRVIQGANRGLLLVGAIHSVDEIWATLIMAKHLSWPVVADILSGLRLRKFLPSFYEIEENLLFVDHLDHALLSDFVRDWVHADVIIQVGSRMTSKRVSQFVENCFPCSYILIDKHPFRHDPSHIVTHRIQSDIIQFADLLLKAQFPQLKNEWGDLLHILNMMVSWEISFQMCSEHSLTEPHVANVISKGRYLGSALFLGNSMAIRDVDMYGCNLVGNTGSTELQCHWIQVAGNRGASGIDGLLSTAIGFAVGCQKRVLCLIGDISFLHDTNGLAILNQRLPRKPMTILVINNHGGAIFSLLPIANRTDSKVLDQYFYTSHNILIGKLCDAHGVKHLQVQSKSELQDALFSSQQEETDCVIEVESCIDANATFHSILRKFAHLAADHAMSLFSGFSVSDSTGAGFFLCDISGMNYYQYRIPLSAPPTSAPLSNGETGLHREGFILALSLADGSVGFGEVAPLEIHRENLVDTEVQLRFLLHALQGAKISCLLPLLRGSFSSWIWNNLGIVPFSIFPSVRCGLEMAILNAIAARQGSSLLKLICPHMNEDKEIYERSSRVQICALIDANGTPEEVTYVATKLVEEGFTALKLKVGRRANPIEDATIVVEVRRSIGNQVQLRVDANRNWTYEEAVQFGGCVKYSGLQYIEEPVKNEDDIIKFCEETGLPVALDETVDKIKEDPLKTLAKFSHSGVVAIVIKPCVVGGFENASLIARWAHQQGKMAVVSSAFESGLSLSAYIQLSCCFDLQNAAICKVMKRGLSPPLAHGLGTYQWLEDDVTTEPLKICQNPHNGFLEASVIEADQLLRKFKINNNVISRNFPEENISTHQVAIKSGDFSYIFKVLEVGRSNENNVLVFLPGFLGISEDWIPIMKGMSGSARCFSIDLPGHGGTTIQSHEYIKAGREPSLSIEVVAGALCELLHFMIPGRVILVGYSMGARISLYMALRFSSKIIGAVLISGSPGLKDTSLRGPRRASDDCRARWLIAHGLENFLDTWYAGEFWSSLRSHPYFEQMLANRLKHEDVHALAKVLSDLSIGRQLSLWEDLKQCQTPLLLIAGEKDSKFKKIALEMCNEFGRCAEYIDASGELCEFVEIPNSGHAAHVENPLHVLRALGQFLTRLRWN